MNPLRNIPLTVTLGILVGAIVASFIVLGLSIRNPTSELPEEYHWEGFRLDRDFARAERATELGVRATLTAGGGSCKVQLAMAGSKPDTLRLVMTHATLPERDRLLMLKPFGAAADGIYTAPCDIESSAGAWRVTIEEPARSWAVRDRVQGRLDGVTIVAMPVAAAPAAGAKAAPASQGGGK